MKQIVVILVVAAKGFQPVEYGDTLKVLQEEGIKVITASDKRDTAISSKGDVVNVDMTIDKIKPDQYDGIFLIGGPGALEHLDNPNMLFVLEEAKKNNKAYGAICISPRILAKARLLENKKATGWDEDNKLSEIFKSYNVNYLKQAVVSDGNIITANGPSAALNFGREIARLLKK